MIRRKTAGIVFALCSLFLCINSGSISASLPAGPVIVSALSDTNQIRIGEQFKIVLKANVPTGVEINFPVFPDTLGGIEVVSRGKIDTLVANDKSNNTFSQSIQVTSFDSGFYAIKPFHFTSLNLETGKIDSFSTEAFLISVITVPVDTTLAIKDIKPLMTVPISWQEIMMYVLAILVVIFIIFFLYRMWKNRKLKDVPVLPKKPKRPAHELALEALKKTEEEKLWQQGFYKQYHSQVSDILREYIERSFDITALELTSDETLERIRRRKLRNELTEKLAYVLHTADLVKFAKLIPLADECEKSITNAYEFINGTRPLLESDIKREETKT